VNSELYLPKAFQNSTTGKIKNVFPKEDGAGVPYPAAESGFRLYRTLFANPERVSRGSLSAERRTVPDAITLE